MEKIFVRLSNYAQVSDVDSLRVKFNEYATLEKQEEMESRVRPLLNECLKVLDGFRHDHEEMRLATLHFDEVLSTKANRWDITQLVKWVETDFSNSKAS